MKSLTHCHANKTRVGRLIMRRGQPVSLKTCENNLQAKKKTIEIGAKIIRKQSNLKSNHSLPYTVSVTEPDWG